MYCLHKDIQHLRMIVGHVMINIVQFFFTGHQQHTNRKLHVQKNSYPLSRQTDRQTDISRFLVVATGYQHFTTCTCTCTNMLHRSKQHTNDKSGKIHVHLNILTCKCVFLLSLTGTASTVSRIRGYSLSLRLRASPEV